MLKKSEEKEGVEIVEGSSLKSFTESLVIKWKDQNYWEKLASVAVAHWKRKKPKSQKATGT